MNKRTYIIEGMNFDTLEGFYDEISKVLIPGEYWGRNLDAFNDILYGGFGTPEEGFVLIWKHSKKSKRDLGHKETIKWLEYHLDKVHQTNINLMKERLVLAKQNQGEILFMTLMDIILDHEEIELMMQ